MSDVLYKWLTEVDLNYQELSKIDDNKWVLVNSNTIYTLLAFYQKNNQNDFVRNCINIINQHLDDLEILQFYGIKETSESVVFRHMPAKDAKVIFKPWEQSKEICSRPFSVLKDVDNKIPFSPLELPKKRQGYIQCKKHDKESEEHQKELKYRKEKGYIV